MGYERDFQPRLKECIRSRLPGCYILKNDASFFQGIPDLIILYKDRWAMLEVKERRNAPFRPNQRFYINELNDMSFAAVVYPENMEEVLDALQQSLQSSRKTRVSRSK